jgi:hypothetical protein
MPITVSPQTGTVIWTPEIQVNWSSDFVGPFPTGSFIQFELQNVGGETTTWRGTKINPNHQGSFTLLHPGFDQLDTNAITGQAVDAGTQMHIVTTLFDNNTNVIDSGVSDPLPWQPTANLPQQIFAQPAPTGGGLTPVQAQQLADVHAAAVPTQLLDALTLDNLTPTGPTDFVGADLPSAVFAVIIRLATIPAELLPTTPDGDYWVKTLAVVRIFRAQDLWQRVPIHTSSHIVGLPNPFLALGLTALFGTAWPLQLSLQVTFLEGVTGEVFLMRVP